VSDWEPFVKPSPFLDSIGPFWQRERDGASEIGLTIEKADAAAMRSNIAMSAALLAASSTRKTIYRA